MEINVWQVVLGGVTASIVWFVVGGALYMNPLIAGIYKEAEDLSVMKQWPSVAKYLSFMFVGACLAQCLLAAFVFALVKPTLPEGILLQGVVFGLILVAIKIFTRFFDMWIQTTYPNKPLAIEFVNGSIGSFVIAFVFVYVI